MSAPAAMSRGTIVSSASSSADRISTFPISQGVPSGNDPPVVIIADKYAINCDFPRPGSPAISEIFPLANLFFQSQFIGRVLISHEPFRQLLVILFFLIQKAPQVPLVQLLDAGLARGKHLFQNESGFSAHDPFST